MSKNIAPSEYTDYGTSYKDNGCIFHPSCLKCPEPICVFDFPGGPKAYLRYREIMSVLRKSKDLSEAAKVLNLSTVTMEQYYNNLSKVTQCLITV